MWMVKYDRGIYTERREAQPFVGKDGGDMDWEGGIREITGGGDFGRDDKEGDFGVGEGGLASDTTSDPSLPWWSAGSTCCLCFNVVRKHLRIRLIWRAGFHRARVIRRGKVWRNGQEIPTD
jgi:hypothetical protein